MDNIYYVYVYLDPRKMGEFVYGEHSFKFEPIYVGMGKNSRLNDHLNEAIRKDSLKTGNKIKFYKLKSILSENRIPIIQKIKDKLSEKVAADLEIELIKIIGRITKNTGPLTNISDGGIGGIKLCGEENPMFGLTGSNHPASQWERTPEYWDHVSNSLTGDNNPMYGKTHTDIVKKQQSDRLKLWWSNLTEEEIATFKENVQSYWTDEKRKEAGERFMGNKNPMYGKTRPDSWRKNQSKKMTGMFPGEKNPNVKIWEITDNNNHSWKVTQGLNLFFESIGYTRLDGEIFRQVYRKQLDGIVTKGKFKGWKIKKIND